MTALEHLPEALRQHVTTFLEKRRRVPQGQPSRTYAVVNQKGGAGKTTTATTLGAIWASWGLRVRLIDVDPQLGSATFWLPPQWPESARQCDLRDVFFEEATLDQATAPTVASGLFIVPSSKTLGSVEFAGLADANLRLREAMQESKAHFDITLLDCRPSLGVLTIAALTAASELLITLKPSGMDLPGLIELSETRDTVKRRLNPDLRVGAVVVCDDPGNTNLSGQIREQLDADYPEALRWRIPSSVRVKEAPFAHEPLSTYSPDSPPTRAYTELAARMLVGTTA